MDKEYNGPGISFGKVKMTEKIIIAGSGGQGAMLLGKVLAAAALLEHKYVTWLPSYGAEVRGGTAHCMVVISDDEIGSPYIDKADTFLALNKPSLEKFLSRLKSGGLLVINSSLVSSDEGYRGKILRHPFTDMANGLGNIKVANMIMLGCYLAKNRIIDIMSVLKAMEDISPDDKKSLIEINKKALFLGRDLLKGTNDTSKIRS